MAGIPFAGRELFGKPRALEINLAKGDTVYVRAMSAKERDDFPQWLKERDGSYRDLYCQYLAQYLCDPLANRLYGDDGLAVLADSPFVLVEEIFLAAMKENGINREGREDAKKE